MDMPLTLYLRTLFGRHFGGSDLVTLFSAHLDETGTDGRSRFTVVAGAVSSASGWGKLETAWGKLLANKGVKAFHWKEFTDGQGDFCNWSKLKRERFENSINKIIERNTIFRVSIGIEQAVHTDIKRRMKGIKGFHPESDYSLCLRYLMFSTSEQLLRIDKDHRLSVLVEDGPYARGAFVTYQRVARMTGPYRPAKHAHRLAGFAAAPKGEFRSLEAADYLAATEHARMVNRRFRRQRGVERLSLLLTENQLEKWYQGMINEKKRRRIYGKRKSKKNLSSP